MSTPFLTHTRTTGTHDPFGVTDALARADQRRRRLQSELRRLPPSGDGGSSAAAGACSPSSSSPPTRSWRASSPTSPRVARTPRASPLTRRSSSCVASCSSWAGCWCWPWRRPRSTRPSACWRWSPAPSTSAWCSAAAASPTPPGSAWAPSSGWHARASTAPVRLPARLLRRRQRPEPGRDHRHRGAPVRPSALGRDRAPPARGPAAVRANLGASLPAGRPHHRLRGRTDRRAGGRSTSSGCRPRTRSSGPRRHWR